MTATTKSFIKKVLCAASIFCVTGFTVFAAPKKAADQQLNAEKQITTPSTLSYRSLRGKIRISEKKGETKVTFDSVGKKTYEVSIQDPVTFEDLKALKNKKRYFTGYVDDDNLQFIINLIGTPAIDEKAAGNAK